MDDGQVCIRKTATFFQKITIDIIYRFGRKPTLIYGAAPIFIAWILIGTANNVPVLYVARILCGLTFGLCLSVMPMYLGEIASTKIRGALAVLITVMVQFGVLLAYSIGAYVSFSTLAFISLVPVVMFLISTIWLPETPYYLLKQKRPADARASLLALRGHSDISIEYNAIEIAMQRSDASFRDLFASRGNKRALIIIVGLTSIQVLCGSLSVIVYAETIFRKIESSIDASVLSIIFGAVQLIAATVAASIVDLIGRRPLLLISVIGTGVCNAIVGLYFSLNAHQKYGDSIAWIPIAAMMIFIICYFLGLATVIFSLLSELFPANMKKVGGAVYTIVSAMWAFIVNKMFQVVSDGLGIDVAFWCFAFFGLVFTPFVWFFVPETKGKNFDEITLELNGVKKK